MTDAELIAASRTDPGASRELYDRWAEPLLAYFYRRVFDAEVAADARSSSACTPPFPRVRRWS